MSQHESSKRSTSTVTAERCQELLERSLALLVTGWENPKDVGLGKALAQECESHLASVKSLPAPHHEDVPRTDELRDLNRDFLRTLKIAWFATWLARDYSLNRWELESDQSVLLNALRYNQTFVIAQRRWLPHHVPAFTREGEPADSPFSISRGVFDLRLFEGSMLRQQSQIESLVQQGVSPCFDWSYFGPGVEPLLPGASSARSAYFESLQAPPLHQSARANDLNGAIVIGAAKLQGLPNLSLLEESWFNSNVEVTGADFGKRPQEVPRSLHAANGLLIADSRICGLTLLPSSRISRVTLSNCQLDGDLVFLPGGVLPDFEMSGTTKIIRRGIKGDDAILSGIVLRGVEVTGSVSFERARFQGRNDFADLKVKDQASFKNAVFTGDGNWPIDFSGSEFGVRVQFSGAEFLNCREVNFRTAKFRLADFSGSLFGVEANFVGACAKVFFFREGESANGRRPVVFQKGANFNATQSFDLSEYGVRAVDPLTDFELVSFTGAIFSDSAQFKGRRFLDRASFDRTTFVGLPAFRGAEFGQGTSFSGAVFNWRAKLRKSWWKRVIARWLPRFAPQSWREALVSDNEYMEGVEREFRALRQRADNLHAKSLALVFHKQELKARHSRIGDPDVPWFEGVLGRLYGLVSNYGDSLSKPIVAFAALWISCGVAYWGVTGREGPFFGPAVSYAWSAQVKPFSYPDATLVRLSSDQPKQCSREMDQRVQDENSVSEFCYSLRLYSLDSVWTRLIAIVQSILTVTLVFVILLAVRRRFQLP